MHIQYDDHNNAHAKTINPDPRMVELNSNIDMERREKKEAYD